MHIDTDERSQVDGTPVTTIVGGTPLVDVSGLSPNPRVRILVKLEGQNPWGSLKDRVAAALIRDARSTGRMRRAARLVVPSSGNTGIAVAALAASLGHPTTVVMPEDASPERSRILRVLGAEIAYSRPERGWRGTIATARRVCTASGGTLLDQYGSDANPAAHRDTTAREILLVAPDVTHFVGVFGTGGCLLGAGRRFLMERARVCTLAVEPPDGEPVEGVRGRRDAETMPLFHRWRGSEVIHGWHTASAGESRAHVLRLARECGMFVGPSTGLALAGALELAGRIAAGTIAMIACDGPWKYLSSLDAAPPQVRKAA